LNVPSTDAHRNDRVCPRFVDSFIIQTLLCDMMEKVHNMFGLTLWNDITHTTGITLNNEHVIWWHQRRINEPKKESTRGCYLL